jgi:hypothetical protein
MGGGVSEADDDDTAARLVKVSNDAKLRGLASTIDAHELSQAGHLSGHTSDRMLDAPSEMVVVEENGEAVRRPWIREEQ